MYDESGYLERLAPGLRAYEQVTGRRVPPELLDPSREDVRAAYAAFLAAPFRIRLGGNDAEWAALRLGIKPMVREVVSPVQWRSMRPTYEAMGYATLALETAVSEEPFEGYTFERGLQGQKEARGTFGADADDRHIGRVSGDASFDDRVIVYVGRDRARLEKARDLDAVFIGRRAGEEEAAFIDAMGGLLGYPLCCTSAFSHLVRTYSNRRPVRDALARTRRPAPLLNNLSLGIFHYIAWFPCRYDCPESLAKVRPVDAHYRSVAPREREKVLHALSMPRVYLDDRRQVLLDGRATTDGVVRYRSVHTPFTFDRQAATAAFDWVFYADVVRSIALGDELRVSGSELFVLRKGVQIAALPTAEEPLLLPFE